MNNQDHLNASSDVQIKLVKRFRIIARTLSLIISVLLLVFSIFSGAEEAGGVVANLPNAIPGALLLIFTLVAWKWEMFGGFILVLSGVFSMFFFDAFEKDAWPVLFIISLPLLIVGGLFVASAGLSRDK